MTTPVKPASTSCGLKRDRKRGCSVTRIAGWMARARSATAVVFALPMLPTTACNCRLVLETQTLSPSTSARWPTPERARASAVQEPTPPRPTTMKEASASRVIPARP